MFATLKSKIDDIAVFLLLTAFLVFPIIRLAVFLATGTVLVGFDILLVVFVGSYYMWLVYSDVIPAIRKRDATEITPIRWLAAAFMLPLVIPNYTVDITTVSENGIATSVMLFVMSYMIGTYKYNFRWPVDYVLTVLDILKLVKAKVQPLMLDVMNNNKKPVVEETPAPSTKGQKEKEEPVEIKSTPAPVAPPPPQQTRRVEQPVKQTPKPAAATIEAVTAQTAFAANNPAPAVEDLVEDIDETPVNENDAKFFASQVIRAKQGAVNPFVFNNSRPLGYNPIDIQNLARRDAVAAYKQFLEILDNAGGNYRSDLVKLVTGRVTA